MNSHIITAIVIFVITYSLMASEQFNRTTIAMFGAVLMMILNVESQKSAFHHIDFNTIFLLIGMMIIVTIMRKTGIFEYMAIKIAKISGGNPWRIAVLFSLLTGVSSAFLDNVTTIMLIVPVTIVIAETLEIHPLPFLLPEVIIANIGGTATLIGDPPNIMIGSATELGFNDFMLNLAPVVIVITIVTIFIVKLIYKKQLVCSEENKNKVLQMDEKLAIKDKSLLIKSLTALSITILGFLLHQTLGYESATIALFGAGLLLLISRLDPEEILMELEWPTIFFFAALFILVGALEEVGIIEMLAAKMLALTGGDMMKTVMIVLWGSALASAFLDNIPFVATMIPLIKEMGAMSGLELAPLWWALALGACLGGNGTLIGASSNVILAGLMNKHGYKMGFVDFMKVGFPIMIVSIILSSIYMFVFYI